MKKKGFTLIELIAVLVILAILALIVTPLVLNIIRKASKSAKMRSVDYYGRSTELAIADYLLDHGKYPNSIENLKVEYKGKEVNCEIKDINDDGTVYLTKCSIGGKIVYNNVGEYYTYGRLNPNYPVYKVGDCLEEGTYVNYKESKWCVINDSSRKQDYVTLMKYVPFTFGETSMYGYDEDGHRLFNNYDFFHSEHEGAYIYDGVRTYLGLVRFYTSPTCGFATASELSSLIETGCKNDYGSSDIKRMIDNYTKRNLDINDLKLVNGYKVRLITKEEIENNFNYENNMQTENTPSWIYENANRWTMTKVDNTNNKVYIIDKEFGVKEVTVWGGNYVYRDGYVSPVINLLKDKIE